MMIATGIQAQGVMDVHSHIITSEFVSALEQEVRLMDEGFPLPKYDVTEHLKWMDEAGIETSVLTLAAPQPTSAEVVRKSNEAAARIRKEHPGRFMFCAALPLPDVQKAIEEAKYALDVLKADGIKLATNVDGQYLGAPELDTLFAVLNERKAVVILHPHRPEPMNKQVMAQTPLAMQEYLAETTRAVTNMISRNELARYPNVKVIVPHCGAYLPLAVPRMKSLTPVMQANKMVGEIDWEANLRALYYDLAGAHSPETIRMILTITTPDHLLYGSDYPYVAPQVLTQSLARMKDYLSKEPDLAPFREMILSENARWLFGQTADKPTADVSHADTMLYRLAPTLIRKGYVYIAESPLYEIESKGKTYFAYSDREKAEIVESLNGAKATINRSKGLGENDPDMMWMTTMNPESRKLIRVMPEDVERTAQMFDLLLGDNLSGRKEHIAQFGSQFLDLADIS